MQPLNLCFQRMFYNIGKCSPVILNKEERMMPNKESEKGAGSSNVCTYPLTIIRQYCLFLGEICGSGLLS